MQPGLKIVEPVNDAFGKPTDGNRRYAPLAVLAVFFAFICLGLTVVDAFALEAKGQTRLHHDLFSVTFADQNQGWASGRWGTILHTIDGGKTWKRQISGTDYTITSIFFVDGKRGWAVGDRGTILHTDDGGANWKKQQSPVSVFLMGVYFVNAQNGWAVGERTNILHTADGGKTWRVQFQGEDYILKSISFCDDRTGWAVGEYGLIYHTVDGGTAWVKQAGGLSFSEDTGDLVAGNILFNVIAVNPQTAWAVGIDGYVTKTTDGGASWQRLEKGIPKVHLFGIARSSGGNVIVVGGDAFLLTSRDGGNTFEAAKTRPPVTYGYIYGIAPVGKTGFVAVGKGGWIYLSDDKVTIWHLAEWK